MCIHRATLEGLTIRYYTNETVRIPSLLPIDSLLSAYLHWILCSQKSTQKGEFTFTSEARAGPQEDIAKNHFVWSVQSTDHDQREYFISCSSEAERSAWLQAVSQAQVSVCVAI